MRLCQYTELACGQVERIKGSSFVYPTLVHSLIHNKHNLCLQRHHVQGNHASLQAAAER